MSVTTLLIGIILVVGSVWWIAEGPYPVAYLNVESGTNLADLVTVLNGALPALIFLIGLFIAWLGLDDLKGLGKKGK